MNKEPLSFTLSSLNNFIHLNHNFILFLQSKEILSVELYGVVQKSGHTWNENAYEYVFSLQFCI
jgi:hypothetical protein